MRSREPMRPGQHRRAFLKSSPVAPGKPPRSRKPVKKRNAKRRLDEWQRTYHSKARVEFVAALPCVVAGVCSNPETHVGPSDNAHIVGGGMGRKADYDTIIPLCRKCHQYLHTSGARHFARAYQISLGTYAALTEERWRARCDAISDAAPDA